MKSIGIVETKYGKVSGVTSDRKEYEGITYFKGIPYAAPPLGELRWRPPADPDCWEGVRACDTYPAMARQDMGTGPSFEPWATDFYYMGHPKNDEDCLYLNVTTGAASAGEKRPVFMWFHGGGLNTGYSFETEFDNSELARRGIVVVTVGQRLNIFGYLCCSQLSEEQGGKSGNYGLMDEVKALDWVSENIAAFGGDPDNITVGGQSGGTAKSGALASSPYQRGRIKRVINQSSLNWNAHYTAIEDEERRARRYFEAIGVNPDCTVEELRAMDAEIFYTKLPRFDFNDPDAVMIPGSMVFDGDYVACEREEEAIDRYAGHCDYLSGVNWGELAMRKGFFLGGSGRMTKEEFYRAARGLLGDELNEKHAFEKLVPVTDETADPTARYLAAKGLCGMLGMYKSRYFGAYRAKKNPEARTYSYLFSHVPPTRPEDAGTERDRDFLLAWHSSELWYMFASLREDNPPARPWRAYDFKLADQMCSYWANFIRTGDPNGAGLPRWPRSDESYGWIELGDEITAHEGLREGTDLLIADYAEQNGNLPRIL